MQSNLVFSAEKKVADEFLLASIVIKAVHRMHKPGVRTEDTMRRVLSILAKGKPVELPPERRSVFENGSGMAVEKASPNQEVVRAQAA